jgi:hypothetical protein
MEAQPHASARPDLETAASRQAEWPAQPKAEADLGLSSSRRSFLGRAGDAVPRRDYLVLVDASRRPTGLTWAWSSALKNRCVSGSVVNTTDPIMPRVSSTL